MKQAQERHIKRKLRTSSLSTMLSISLVLLMLGSMGFIYINTNRLTNYIKENVGVSLILEDNIKKVDRFQLQKNLDASPWVKSSRFVSKDDAAKILESDLGEDFISFLGFNPLSASIEVFLNAEYASEQNFIALEKEIEGNEIIKEIIIQKDLIDSINSNVRKLSLILVSFCVLLLIVAIALINNTIRLTVYSKRFIIRTMKLVGATNSFVRKPFLRSGLIQGVFSGLIGVILLISVLFSLHKEMPELLVLQDMYTIVLIFVGILLFGVLMSVIVTNIAVGKYLKMNENDLYH
ncbi:MAG: permease-like cell division protein FtsX [Flavobacteriales bacterium]|jgi:cell division transport system permease protein|nr:permease-like cell division protein FtsX [Flavobacteriales bacterium]|tara:strand:- start:3147 stop:4025 length:879 start_codon:yes stop_codon:yes gene_type:complete